MSLDGKKIAALPIRRGKSSSRKTSISDLLAMPKPLTVVDHNKLWKILKEMGIPDHLICLLRNLYAGQDPRDVTSTPLLAPNFVEKVGG